MTLRRHAMSYAAIGLVQWLVEYGLMVVLSRWLMPVEPANVIGRVAGAVLGFWLNGKWTFAGDDTHVGRHAAARFVAMWVALTVLNTWIVAAIDDRYGLGVAQLLKPGADVVSGGIGFLLSRHWVYKKAPR
ncbi:MAG: GtrA family protein [Xanthomonadales bacterium]|nr:GtrA family protein [Xanthomonadales bacterium]